VPTVVSSEGLTTVDDVEEADAAVESIRQCRRRAVDDDDDDDGSRGLRRLQENAVGECE
jgi:hypothetical protein